MANTFSDDDDKDELERLRLEVVFYLAKLEATTSPESKRRFDRPKKINREERIRWYRQYLLIKYGLSSKQASAPKPIVQSTYMCPCRLVPIRRYTHE